MSEVNSTMTLKNSVKIGKFNLPTITGLALFLPFFSLFAAVSVKSQSDFFLTMFFVFCLLASILGLATIFWSLIKIKNFFEDGKKNYFWKSVLLGLAAFTSPIWIFIVYLFVTGFNR